MRKKTEGSNAAHTIDKADKKISVKKSEKKSEKTNALASTSSSSIVSDSVPGSALPVVKTLILYKDVPSEKCFILCDGRTIHNCKELADILTIISDDVFGYHVTDNKNDFSNWANDVFLDHTLAKKISLIRNRMDMSVEIYRHMFELLEKMN